LWVHWAARTQSIEKAGPSTTQPDTREERAWKKRRRAASVGMTNLCSPLGWVPTLDDRFLVVASIIANDAVIVVLIIARGAMIEEEDVAEGFD
jgi:hypothetical protein